MKTLRKMLYNSVYPPTPPMYFYPYFDARKAEMITETARILLRSSRYGKLARDPLTYGENDFPRSPSVPIDSGS